MLSLLTGLRKLSIRRAAVDDMPGGAYLAAATQLRHLDLAAFGDGVDMTSADVAVLSSLKSLCTLRLEKPLRSRFWAVWESRLDTFRKQCILQGRLPPVVVELYRGTEVKS